jgi:hypothetical protein
MRSRSTAILARSTSGNILQSNILQSKILQSEVKGFVMCERCIAVS